MLTQPAAEWARKVVESALDIVDGEQVLIGTSHVGLFNTKSAWPSARVMARSGVNGADIELLGVLTTENLAQRFDEVAVVSGDGIFADVVAQLGGSGVQVTVAGWATSLSNRLRVAGSRTILLDNWAGHHTFKEIA